MLKESIGHPFFSISPLGTKGRDGRAQLKAVLKESIGHTVPSISPLGTKVSGCEVVLRESIGHNLLSIISLVIRKGMDKQH